MLEVEPGLPSRRSYFVVIMVSGYEVDEVMRTMELIKEVAKRNFCTTWGGKGWRRAVGKARPRILIGYFETVAVAGSPKNVKSFMEGLRSVIEYAKSKGISVEINKGIRPIEVSYWYIMTLRAPSYPPLGNAVAEIEDLLRSRGMPVSTKFRPKVIGTPREAVMRFKLLYATPDENKEIMNEISKILDKYRTQGLESTIRQVYGMKPRMMFGG